MAAAGENPVPEEVAGEPVLEEDHSFGSFDSGIVQLSDTELDGVPYEEIVDSYDSGEVDAVVYAGDASKKMQKDRGMIDPNTYFEQLEDTYQDLSEIGEELDTEILVEPGNHAPIKEAHSGDTKYVEEVESILQEEYSEFSDFDGNAYEFMVDEYDLTNIEMDSVDVGDMTVVGGTHHDGEWDIEKEWLEDAPGLEELGYSESQLEEMAEELSAEGGFAQKLLSIITLGTYTPGTDKSPGDITVEDAESYGDLTEEHMDYKEAVELYEDLSEMIESAENDVYLAHHGIPESFDKEHGSTVADKLAEDYSDKLAGVGGGHTGEPGFDENYGVPMVNTNHGAVVEMGYNQGKLSHIDNVVGTGAPDQDPKNVKEEIDGRIEQLGDVLEQEDMEQEQEEVIRQRIDQLEQKKEFLNQVAGNEAGRQAPA